MGQSFMHSVLATCQELTGPSVLSRPSSWHPIIIGGIYIPAGDTMVVLIDCWYLQGEADGFVHRVPGCRIHKATRTFAKVPWTLGSFRYWRLCLYELEKWRQGGLNYIQSQNA